MNILIYRVGQLGDTLIALPAIHAIVARHAGARIVLMTDRHPTARGYVSSWDVLEPTGWFDEVIFYTPRGLGRLQKLRQALALLGRLRREGFSHAYNLARRNDAAAVRRDRVFFHTLAGIRNYVGVPHQVYPPQLDADGQPLRLEPDWRRLAALAGESPGGGAAFRLPLPTSATAELQAAFPEHSAADATPRIVVAPGSKMAAKKWPEARFAELGQLLLAAMPGLRLVVVGGPEDAATGDRLCAAWGARSHNLAGRLSVYGSAALMQASTLYVGNDTGTMHLAGMAGLPCVAIFSARDYRGLWEPFGTGHTILRKPIDCAGCMLETCTERRNACLEAISVAEVLSATLASLARALKPAAA